MKCFSNAKYFKTLYTVCYIILISAAFLFIQSISMAHISYTQVLLVRLYLVHAFLLQDQSYLFVKRLPIFNKTSRK